MILIVNTLLLTKEKYDVSPISFPIFRILSSLEQLSAGRRRGRALGALANEISGLFSFNGLPEAVV